MGHNKGAVAVALRLLGHPVLFVNSHLAAGGGGLAKKGKAIKGAKYLRRRNADVREVMANLMFNRKGAGALQDVEAVAQYSTFWLGDLNYRFDGLDRARALALCRAGDWPRLYARHDQLRRAMAAREVFYGFHEAPVRCPPTYKYVPCEARPSGSRPL